jgi:hypothetical protein
MLKTITLEFLPIGEQNDRGINAKAFSITPQASFSRSLMALS